MKYYTMKEKSAADYSPNYRPCLTGKCTNGNIIVGGYKYSDDGGATWKSSTGETTVGSAIFINGNDVWKGLFDGTNFKVYKSTDSGASFSQIGVAFNDSGYTTISVVGLYVGAVGTWFLGLSDTGGFHYYSLFEYSAGAWTYRARLGGIKVTVLGVDYSLVSPVRGFLYNSLDSKFYFISNLSHPSDVPSVRIYTFLKDAPYTGAYEYIFESMAPGGNKELKIDSDYTSDNYYSIDQFSYDSISGYWFLTGAYYTDNGATFLYNVLYRTTNPAALVNWGIVANERIAPILGTSPRIWGVVIGSNKIYISHNNGGNFFPVAYKAYSTAGVLVASTWEGGVEVSDSDRGFGAFDGGKFYTFQEVTWGDWFGGNDITIGMGSQVGKVNKLDVRETRIDDFFDGRVIQLFDNAATPAIMFTGKVTNKLRVGNLYTVELQDLKIELTAKKPIKTFTAQSVELMAEYLATLTNFVYDGGNITSPGGAGDSWSISYKGGVSIAEMLDEICKWVNYIWYCKGDLELILDDGTTSSSKIIGTGGVLTYGVPETTSDGLLIATKVIVKGRVESNGPVIARYPPDTDLDLQTRHGEIVARINRPNWDYDQCLAYATQIYNERSEWTDKLMIPIPLDDTLRPGTTLQTISVSDVTDGTYIITQVRHIDGVTEVTLNNSGIAFEDLTKEQEYARASLDDEWTPQDAAESAASSTIIEKDSIDNICAGIQTKRISAAQAQTLVYDSTHKVLTWVDSAGTLHTQPVGDVVFDKTSGIMSFSIKATGGAGTEDVWLNLDAEDDSAIIFKENGTTKGYVKWDKGDADLIIDSAGDIKFTDSGRTLTLAAIDAALAETRTAMTLENSWANLDPGYAQASYWKIGDTVFLEGLVKGGTAINATIETLPVGFRPPAQVVFAVYTAAGVARLDVTTAGVIYFAAGGSTTWSSLCGCNFRV